jgi:hypothetical protein
MHAHRTGSRAVHLGERRGMCGRSRLLRRPATRAAARAAYAATARGDGERAHHERSDTQGALAVKCPPRPSSPRATLTIEFGPVLSQLGHQALALVAATSVVPAFAIGADPLLCEP